MRIVRQPLLDHGPFDVGQVISAHAKPDQLPPQNYGPNRNTIPTPMIKATWAAAAGASLSAQTLRQGQSAGRHLLYGTRLAPSSVAWKATSWLAAFGWGMTKRHIAPSQPNACAPHGSPPPSHRCNRIEPRSTRKFHSSPTCHPCPKDSQESDRSRRPDSGTYDAGRAVLE